MKRIIAAVILCAAPLLAQDSGPIVWPFSFGRMGVSTIMRKTGISDVQMRKIEAQYRGSRDTLIDQRAEVEKAEAALRELLDAPQLDLTAAERALERALAARTALSRTSSLMMLKMRQELTQEQWHKLQEIAPPPPPPPAPPAATAQPVAPKPPASTPKAVPGTTPKAAPTPQPAPPAAPRQPSPEA